MCNTAITVDTAALLRGEKCACANCQTAIALEPGPGAHDTVAKFEQAKQAIRRDGVV
ncbi:hypothetical protein ELI_07865 [Erythrobacter litoralis HTCC2594]|uniref:Uncharacterized protein n=1 Tax=Erythrobacter litoralis (strain HTCC2594) TaxID=314225 RepID=Q2N9H6_ERYLH|nr:hypothetical protein ELI_07865 [Erythrobacter litoralis HTCC2594]